MKHIVEDNNLRIDRYCANNLAQLSSLNRAKKWIKMGCILLNGKRVETSRFVTEGDILEINPPGNKFETWNKELKVIFEDAHLAIVYKPAGLHVSGNHAKTIRKCLPFNLSPTPLVDPLPQPEPVHRLDRRTQGLLLIAKTCSARHKLGQLFEQRSIIKKYQCLCIGQVADGFSNTQIEGKDAYSSWTVLSIHKSFFTTWVSHLEVTINTGRQHQIRKHLNNIGHSILGDDLYCVRPPLRSKGLFLFATHIEFQHPFNSRSISIELSTPAKILKRIDYEQRIVHLNNSKQADIKNKSKGEFHEIPS
jgi:23S rRNA pseudouridine1911/1915/1917 synthase